MTNEEGVITEEPKVDNELESLRAEKARLESELASKSATEDRIHQAELARTKAEAELNATKAFIDAQRTGQVAQVSEEQWKALEDSTGVSRAAYMANANISQQQIEIAKKEFNAKLKESEERHSKAQEELKKFSSERSLEKTYQTFLESKPQLSRYKNEVKEFVDMFSEQDRADPEKLKNILSKAETYVKGKVGDKMRLNAGSSPKLGAGSDELEVELGGGSGDFDPIGLQTDAQVRLVRDLKSKQDNDATERDQKLMEKFQSNDKQGVVYSGEKDWAENQPKFNR